MFEQILQLTKQFVGEAIVNNNAVSNDKNDALINETSTSIFSGLKDMVANGDVGQLAELFNSDNSQKSSNPAIQNLTNELTNNLGSKLAVGNACINFLSNELTTNLGSKLGLSAETASGVASTIIPQILGSLIGKAKNPSDSSFNVSDIVKALSGGSAQRLK